MKLHLVFLALLLALFGLVVAQAQSRGPALRQAYEDYLAERRIASKADTVLIVLLEEQCMFELVGDSILREYEISGAALGAGNLSGSNQTPLGLHRVKERHGDGVPVGGILKSRQYTGEVATIYTDATDVEEDHVTTRVLWLEGLEPGYNQGGNVDSYRRYIYIHGTPEEGLLGQPASHGCIRMVNTEVIELYDRTPLHRLVLILPHG